MTEVDLGSKRLFTEQPNQNNYVTIATVVAQQIPLANIFNGQQILTELAKHIIQNAQSNVQNINFADIQKVLSFKMFKMSRPKVIFSVYLSRVLPESTQSNAQGSQYIPSVQFKIDYDTCCVGAMTLLLTTDIQVRNTLGDININGFTAHGNSSGISINYDRDVKSIQYQYCTDFIYHYIDRISLGFANTGGNAPIWHQEVPIEIAKIYHTILSPPGICETIKRAVREDMFIIAHDPHRQFGDFSFQIKSPASIPANTTVNAITGGNGLNFGFTQQIQNSQSQYNTNYELAMYWNDTAIKEVGFGGLTNTNSYTNPNNIQITFKDPKSTNSTFDFKLDSDKDKIKTISKLDLSTELYWRFGSESAKITISSGSNIVQRTLTNEMLYMPIVDNVQRLVPIIQGLSKQSKFPYFENAIQDTTPYFETVYLLPYVLYSADVIQFAVAIVTKLPTNKYYEVGQTATGVTLQDGTTPSIFGSKVNILVTDSGHNGSMDYNLTSPNVKISDDNSKEINTLFVTGSYDLTIDNGSFVVNALNNKGAFYLENDTLSSFQSFDSTSLVSESGLVDAGFKKCIMASAGNRFGNTQQTSLLDFMTTTAKQMGAYILQRTGTLSPLMQQANIAYINVTTKPYDENDLMLNSEALYKQANGAIMLPNNYNALAVFRYNAAMACNQQSEENYPAIRNIDDVSIHTFRKNHGIVDFYFPLQFLFICNEICNSFPHYACSAQSIIVKFDFCNPLAFINTSISINPSAMDPLDFAHNERILINRVNPITILQSNTQNMKFILYYLRYAWTPILNPILANYKHYSWITNNYERFYKIYENLPTNQQTTLCQFNKSNFYTRVWAFVTNKETIEVINGKGQPLEYIPIYVNRYNLESWDKMRFNIASSISTQGAQLTGSNVSTAQNSTYFQVPFESCQLVTKTSINMTDDLPYRAQMLYPYLMLEHQQQHSALTFNNLLQFNIDSVFYQEGFPNCMYSPAFAPDFELKATTKSGQQQDFGMIIIPEYKNISYITSHVMLMKYSNNS